MAALILVRSNKGALLLAALTFLAWTVDSDSITPHSTDILVGWLLVDSNIWSLRMHGWCGLLSSVSGDTGT